MHGVCFAIIKNFCCRCRLPIFSLYKGSVTHFFRAWGNTTHFQNELKETLPMTHLKVKRSKVKVVRTQSEQLHFHYEAHWWRHLTNKFTVVGVKCQELD